jgi:hypothetical protein
MRQAADLAHSAHLSGCAPKSMIRPTGISPLFFALIALALSGPLMAQDFPRTPAEYLKRMDSNGDGKVSESEYLQYMTANFRRMDVNNDGYIDVPQGSGGSKRITLKDFEANLVAQFHRMDRNHDGYLSAKELAQPPG